MAPVTEIAYLTLKPGLKLGVELTGSSPTAQIWTEAMETITQQPGYQRLHWGLTLEDESLLMVFIGTFPPLSNFPS